MPLGKRTKKHHFCIIFPSTVHTEVFPRKDGTFFMKKSTICVLSLLFALAVTVAWTAADAHETQEDLAGKLIRLHVIANSDSEADQTLKLAVRDAVLDRAETYLNTCTSVEEAEMLLRADLPQLEREAAAVTAAAGYDYAVQATLSWEDYPTQIGRAHV